MALGFMRKAPGCQRPAVSLTRTALDFSRTPLSQVRPARGGQRPAAGNVRMALGCQRSAVAFPRTPLGMANSTLDRVRLTINNPRTMNRDQLNVTDMASTVSAYMGKNKTIWGGVKAITDTMTEVDAEIAAIAEADKKQQAPTTGAAEDKATVRHEYEDQILLIADQLASLAAKKKDAVLEAQVELSLAALDKLSAELLEASGKRVSGLATANIAALADYGITAADVTALDNLTAKFHGAKTAPREAVVGRKQQTDVMPGRIANLRSILRRQLDRQMTAFKRSNPEFYAGYLSARVIVDRGGSGGKKPAPTPPAPAK